MKVQNCKNCGFSTFDRKLFAEHFLECKNKEKLLECGCRTEYLIRQERDNEIAEMIESIVLTHIEDDDNRLSIKLLKGFVDNLKI